MLIYIANVCGIFVSYSISTILISLKMFVKCQASLNRLVSERTDFNSFKWLSTKQKYKVRESTDYCSAYIVYHVAMDDMLPRP